MPWPVPESKVVDVASVVDVAWAITRLGVNVSKRCTFESSESTACQLGCVLLFRMRRPLRVSW